MFCKYCGYEYQNDDAIFCPNCGKKLEEESIEAANSNSQSIESEKPSVTYYDLGPLCMQFRISSKLCEFGSPITNITYSKFDKLAKKYEIKENEQVYFMYHSDSFITISEGFAICSSGIYGVDTNYNKFYLSWDRFKTCEYKRTNLGFLIIDNHEIGVVFGHGKESKLMLQLLDAIKASI